MNFKKFNFKFYFLFFTALLTIQSCSLFEPVSPIASYLHIDSIFVQTDYQTQGSNSNTITDVWVIYDNAYLGTFPLPADIPLIGEGSHNLIIKAGIVENGIFGTRAAYPKYNSFDTTMILSATKTTYLSPDVTYGSSSSFPQIEDFDDASLSLVTTTTGTVPLTITQQSDPNSFEGNSGNATLDSANSIFEVASSSSFELPLNTTSYLELNYKCDVGFDVGVFITSSSGIVKSNLLFIKASSEWKKIYINLSNTGGVVSGAFNYKIFLHAEKSSLLTADNLYFDNLKVVF